MLVVYGVPQFRFYDMPMIKTMIFGEVDIIDDIKRVVNQYMAKLSVNLICHPFIDVHMNEGILYGYEVSQHSEDYSIKYDSITAVKTKVPEIIIKKYDKILYKPDLLFFKYINCEYIHIAYGVCADICELNDMRQRLLPFPNIYIEKCEDGDVYLFEIIEKIELSQYNGKTYREIMREYPDNKLFKNYRYEDYTDFAKLIKKVALCIGLKRISAPMFMRKTL